jgi:hypothetical protein
MAWASSSTSRDVFLVADPAAHRDEDILLGDVDVADLGLEELDETAPCLELADLAGLVGHLPARRAPPRREAAGAQADHRTAGDIACTWVLAWPLNSCRTTLRTDPSTRRRPRHRADRPRPA